MHSVSYHILSLLSNTMLFITLIALGYSYYKTKRKLLKYLFFFFIYYNISNTVMIILASKGIHNICGEVLFINLEYIFYFLLYYYILHKKASKRITLSGLILFEAYFIWDYIFHFKSWDYFPGISIAIGQVLMIFVLFLFLLEMMSSEKIMQIQRYFIFWLTIGLLFYYIVPLPVSIATEFFINGKYSTDIYGFVISIQLISNIVLYSLIILGTKWRSTTYK